MSGTVQSTHLNAARVTVDNDALMRKTMHIYTLAKAAHAFEGQGLEGDNIAKRTLAAIALYLTGAREEVGVSLARAAVTRLLPTARDYAAEAVSVPVRQVRMGGVARLEAFLKNTEG